MARKTEMADSFFDFNVEIPIRLPPCRKGKYEEFMESVEDEDEYDALNDETFGGANDENWEECHDKYAEAVVRRTNDIHTSLLNDSLFDADDSQCEIISKSISQLGLEDDLDDPAIMTVGRSRSSCPIESAYRSSPPPPAIIDPQLCGSPQTHSIWSTSHSSTPVKETGVGSLLHHTIPRPQPVPAKLSPVPFEAFNSPLSQKAWTVEEIERNLLNSSSPVNNWCGILASRPDTNHVDYCKSRNFSPQSFRTLESSRNTSDSDYFIKNSPICSGFRTLDDVENDILLKPHIPAVDKIERGMKSNQALRPFQENSLNGQVRQPIPPLIRQAHPLMDLKAVGSRYPPPSMKPGINEKIQQNHIPGPGIPLSVLNNYMFNQTLRNRHPFDVTNQHDFVKCSKGMDVRLPHYRYASPSPLFYPTSVLNHQTMNFPFIPARTIRHPMLHKELPGRWRPQVEMNFYNSQYTNHDCDISMSQNIDEYSGLMSTREKEWLFKIQLTLLNSDNPYVEDYYYSMYITRKCAKEALKNSDNKDGPKLLVPERSKQETKTYVPAQFEGSLGKLQAVSVNCPRRVLDIIVSRPLEDDEGRVVTNQSLMKYRRLLLDIEKLYNCLLEIDEEEKRIFALPDDAQAPHKENIVELTEKLVSGLGCTTVALDDTFQNIMTVRKGRNLGIRAFQIFSEDQKVSFLMALFRCLPSVLRKDMHDMVFLKNIYHITNFLKTLTLSELVLLGESLENLPYTSTDSVLVSSSGREKSNCVSAFKYKFGSSIICTLLQCAEGIYSDNKSSDSEAQARWTKVVLHISDVLCAIQDAGIIPPTESFVDLINHFQRFAVERDQFEILRMKLKIFCREETKPEKSEAA